jgi:hypothetical protein
LLAVAHIGTAQAAAEAVRAGVDGLAHLFIDCPPDAGFGRLLREHHAFVIPTLAVLEALDSGGGTSLARDARLYPWLTQQAIGNLKAVWATHPPKPARLEYAWQTEKQLIAAGVPVLAGTDAPNKGTWFGVSLHRELELLVRGGMSPIQALQAATSVPASVFHLVDRGRIAAGFRADLLLVKGDPTRDVTATREIVGVWKLGVPVNREDFRTEIARSRAEVESLRHAAPPAGSEAGLISDFEDGKATSAFGAGWSIAIGFQGGASTASMKVVDAEVPTRGTRQSGARGSGNALDVSGEIVPDVRYPIAGLMFSPGGAPSAPANLSGKKGFSFWVKGDGRTYQLMVFARSGGGNPVTQKFTATADWQRVSFPFSSLGDSDGFDVTGIQFMAGPEAGKFEFQIDDVRLEP